MNERYWRDRDERDYRDESGWGSERQRERDEREHAAFRRDDARFGGRENFREGRSFSERRPRDFPRESGYDYGDYDYRQNQNFGRTQADYGYGRSYGERSYGEGTYPRYGQGTDFTRSGYDRQRGEDERGYYRAQVYGGERGGRDLESIERSARSDWDDSRIGMGSYERQASARWPSEYREGSRGMGSSEAGYRGRDFGGRDAREGARGFVGRGPKGYIRSDERIREDVCERLSLDDEVDASDITVSVRSGEVTLEGTVESRHMKHIAEDISEAVPGVSDVHNNISVRRSLMRELADKVTGNEPEPGGHAYSGTKTTAGTLTGQSNLANGRTQ